eukprot:TRINITY_DN181_c0_g1_i1.p1 TRINITY_DN181_c0_g1~~TRINITY_DN181_c0_g1_i1.p1  ORF type:complete len:3977 (-),score=642.26 TRINITY_DN181_c0_g1_i1:114-12044(-)
MAPVITGNTAKRGRQRAQQVVCTCFLVIFLCISPSDGGPLGTPNSITLQDNTPGMVTKAIFRFTTLSAHSAGDVVTISGCPFTLSDKIGGALNPPSTTSVAGNPSTVKLTIDAPIPIGSVVEGVFGSLTTMGTEGVSGSCTITHGSESGSVTVDNITPGIARRGEWLAQAPGAGGTDYVIIVFQITAFSSVWKFDIPPGYSINNNWYQILAPGTLTAVSVTYTASELTITGTGGSIANGAVIAVAVDVTLPNPAHGLDTFGIRCYSGGTLVDTGVGYVRPTNVASYGTSIGGLPSIETDDAAAGAVTRYLVQVDMPDAMDSGDQVMVSFPPTWYGDSGVRMDASPQVVFEDPVGLTASSTAWDDGAKVLNITLGAAIPASTALTFTIANVRNPILLLGETYGNVHTNPMTNGPNGISLPAITPVLVPDATFTPHSLTTSTTGPANFTMTFLNGLPVGGVVEIYLDTAWDGPVGPDTADIAIDGVVDASRTFSVTYSTSATVCSGQESPPDRVPVAFHGQLQGHVLSFPGSYNKPSAGSGDQLKLVLQGQAIDPGTKLTVIIPDIVTPTLPTDADLGAVGVWYSNCSTPLSLVSHVTVAAIGTLTGTLTHTSVALGDATPSRPTDFVLTFTPENIVPISGVIVVQLPYLGLWHFKPDILSTTHAVTVSGIAGTAVLNVIERRLEVTVSSSLAAGSQVNLTIPDVTTPATAGPIGGAIVSTWTAGQATLIDGYTVARLPRLSVADLGHDIELVPSSYDSAQVVSMSFTFTTTADIHEGASLSLRFPPDGWSSPGSLGIGLVGAPTGVSFTGWGYIEQSHTLWLILTSEPYITPAGSTLTVNIGSGFTSPTVAQPGYVHLRVHDYGTTQQQTEKMFLRGIGLPDNPTLTLDSVYPCNATFSWNVPTSTGGSPITGYKLYHNNGSISTPASVLVFNGTATSTTVHTLTFAVTYTFIATAVTALGESSTAFPVTGTPLEVSTPDLQASDVNFNLLANYDGDVTVTFRNLGVFCVSEYHLFSDDGLGGPWVLNASFPASPYVVPGLIPGVTYAFALAVGGPGPVNESAIITSSSVTIPEPAAPTAPSTPVVLDVNATMITVNVSIADVTENGSPVHTVSVYRNDGAGGSATIFVANASVSMSGSVLWASVAITSLSGDKTYEIRATVHNSVGESAPSTSVFVGTPGVPPSAVTSLTAATVNRSAIAVSWSLPASNGTSPLEAYTVTWGVVAGAVIGNVNTTDLSMLLSGLTSSTTYSINVTVWNGPGESPIASVQATTDGNSAPASPLQVGAFDLQYTSAKVNWTAPSDDGGSSVTEYRVYCSDDGGISMPSAGNTGGTELVVTGLAPGTSMICGVAAANNVGESVMSNITFATIAPQVATAPSTPAVLDVNATMITVNVSIADVTENGSPVHTVSVYRNDGAGGSATIFVANASVSMSGSVLWASVDVTGLSPGLQYQVRATVHNSVGESTYSPSITRSTPIVLPSAPIVVSATAVNGSRISVNVSLALVDSGGGTIDIVSLYRDNGAAGAVTAFVANVTANMQWVSVAVDNLLPVTSYVFEATVWNSLGESSRSAGVTGTTSATIPCAPGPPVLDNINATVAFVNWTSLPCDGGNPITSYNVYTDAASPGGAIATSLGSTLLSSAMTVIGSPLLQLRVAVTASNSIGESAASSAITINFAAGTVPTAPGQPVLVQVTSTSISVNWTTPSYNGGYPITSYLLYVNDVENSNLTSVPTSATITSLSSATEYKIHVVAWNTLGGSVASTSINVTTPVFLAVAPDPPTSLVFSSITYSSVVISWTAPADDGGLPILGYNLYSNISSSAGPLLSLANTTGTGTSFTHSGLSPSTTYQYQVAARNSLGLSVLSSLASVTLADPSAPNAPTSLSSTAQTSSTVKLSWSAPSANGAPITKYEVYSDSAAGGAVSTLAYSGTSTSPTVTGLLGSKDYRFMVRAINSAGAGVPSSVITASTKAPVKPGPPVSPSISDIKGDSMKVSWSAPTDSGGSVVSSYDLMWDQGDSGSTLVKRVSTSSTSVVVDNLTPSTTYKFNVIAINGIGSSSSSSDVSGTTTKPSKPELVFADLPAKIYSSQSEITVSDWLTVKLFDFVTVSAGFEVTENSDVFSETPKLTWASGSKSKGSLLFTPSATKFGDAKVTLAVTYRPKDGGSSSALTHEFTITVTKAPATPSITVGSSDDLTVKRNAPASVLTDWFKVDPASPISKVVVAVGNTTNPLFAESPKVTYPGSDNEHATLTFKPSAEFFGQVNIKVHLEYADGLLQTAPVSFVITVQRDMFLGDGKPRILGSIATQDKVTVSENGDSQTFTVTLSIEPSAAVTVQATSSDVGEVSISPTSLTFAASAYSVAQTLTLTGVDDPDDDGDIAVDIQVKGTAANALYDGVTFKTTVLNGDNETASWSLRTLGGLGVTPGTLLFENGTNEDVVVVSIQYQPAAPIEIPLTSTPEGGLQFVPASLAFTTTDWSIPQTVTIRAVDDHIAGQGTRNVTANVGPIQSTDIWYGNLQKSISYSVNDDENPQLLVVSNPQEAALLEDGGKMTLSISLSAIPISDVSVAVVVSQQPELDRALVSLSTMEWIIPPARWNDQRDVIITALQDDLKLGMQNVYIAFNTSSRDRLFNHLGYNTVIVHMDDDGSGIMTSPISGPVSENGGAIEMYIAPAGPDVISSPESVTVVSSDESEVVVQPGSIALKPSDWSAPQIITIRGVDDNERDGDQEVTLTMRSATIGTREFTVINRDDDLPDVIMSYVSDQGDKDVITELGQSRNMHVHLSIVPTGAVTAECKPSSAEEAEVKPAMLTFTPSDYNQNRVVTVTGIPDYTEDGDRRVLVTCTVVESEDESYAAGTSSALSFLNRHYSYPNVQSLKPSVSSLNGTIITMLLENIDPSATTISIGGIPMEYNVSRSNLRGLRRMGIDVHHPYRYSFHSPLIDQEGYVEVAVSNPNGARTVLKDILYYTSDCPIEGMFGRGTACKPCPEGASCPGGFRLIPNVGYWNSEESSGYVVKCEPERCLGGVGSPCAPGYTGKACSACESKYYLEGPLCRKCEGTEKELALLIGVAALFFSALTVAAFWAKDMTLTHVATMMVAVQLLQRVGALSAPYLPRWMQQYYAAMSIITLNISFLRPECSGLSGYTGRLIGDAIVLFVAYTPVTIGLPVMGYYRVRRARSKEDFAAVNRYRFFYKHRLPRSLLILWSLLYLHVTSRFSEALFCREYDGELYLVADTTMKCFETEHAIVFVLCVIALLIFSVAIPIAGFVFMIKYKHQLYRRHILARFGFLYESFKPKYYLSHYATTMVSFAIAVGTVLMTGTGSTRYIVTGLVFCVYAFAIVYFQPYKHTWKNWSTAAVICIAFLGTVLLFLADNGVDIEILRGLAITIFILSVLMMCTLLVFLVRFVLQSEEMLKRFSVLRRFTSIQTSTKRSSSKYETKPGSLKGFSINPAGRDEAVDEDEIDRAMAAAAATADANRLTSVDRNTNEMEMQSPAENPSDKGLATELSAKHNPSPSVSTVTAVPPPVTGLGDRTPTEQGLGASSLDLDWASDLGYSRGPPRVQMDLSETDDPIEDLCKILEQMDEVDKNIDRTMAHVDKEVLRTNISKGEKELDNIDSTLRSVDNQLTNTHADKEVLGTNISKGEKELDSIDEALRSVDNQLASTLLGVGTPLGKTTGVAVQSTQVLSKAGEYSSGPVRSTKSELSLSMGNVRAKNLMDSSTTSTSRKTPTDTPKAAERPRREVPPQLLYTESQLDSSRKANLTTATGSNTQRERPRDPEETDMAFRYPLNRPSTSLVRRSVSQPDLTSPSHSRVSSGLSKTSGSPNRLRLGSRTPIERSPLVMLRHHPFKDAPPSTAPGPGASGSVEGSLGVPALAGLYKSAPGASHHDQARAGSVGSCGPKGEVGMMQDYEEMVASLPDPNTVAPVPSVHEDAALEDILRDYLAGKGYEPVEVSHLPVPAITRVDDDDLSWLDEEDF